MAGRLNRRRSQSQRHGTRRLVALAARVARAFVARRPFLHGPAAGRRFTTPIAPFRLPVPVVAAHVFPAGAIARIHPAVRPRIFAADGTAVIEAVIAHAPVIGAAAARVLAAARITMHVAVIGSAEIPAIVDAPRVLPTALGRATGGRALLHHPLLGTGIAPPDRPLGCLRRFAFGAAALLGGRTRRRLRCTPVFLRAAGLLCGAGPLGGATAPLLGGLDDLGRGPS